MNSDVGSLQPFLCSMLWILLTAGLLIDIVLLARLPHHLRRLRRNSEILRDRPWTMSRGGGFLLCLATGALLLQLLTAWLQACDLIDIDRLELWAMIAAPLGVHGCGLVALILLMHRNRLGLGQSFGLAPRRCARAIGVAIILSVAMLPPIGLVNWLHHLALHAAGTTPEPQHVITMLASRDHPQWLYITITLVASLLAPIGEEIYFRGMALPILGRHASTGRAVVLVSALFALMHMHLPSLPVMFMLGIFFSIGYIYSASILTPILMHALFNLANLAALFYLL